MSIPEQRDGVVPADAEMIEFWVHNHAVMPESVQRQVFQRSFTTKGRGRGLGTYSVKLLTERYLEGGLVHLTPRRRDDLPGTLSAHAQLR